MKNLAKIISFLALAASLVPSLLYFTGTIGHDAVKWTALAGTIIWFISTPLWAGQCETADTSAN